MRPLLAALCLVLATSACQTPRAGGGRATTTVEGQVEKVGRDDGTLTLRIGEEPRTILIAPEAEIRIDDFRGSFEDLQEGQRVRASLAENGAETEGFWIEILDQGVAAPDDAGLQDEAARGARSERGEADRPYGEVPERE